MGESMRAVSNYLGVWRNRLRTGLLLLAAMGTGATARGLVLDLSDGNSAVSIDVDSQHGVFNWIVEGLNLAPTNTGGATDHRQWFWYRVGSNPEASIHTLTRGTTGVSDANFDGNPETAFVSYSGVPGFRINATFILAGGTAGSGGAHLREQISIVNTSAASISLSLFKYADFQLSTTTAAVDTVTFAGSNTVLETGAVDFSMENVLDPTPTHWEAQTFPVTITKLTNSVSDTLADNAGAGPGAITWASQWDVTLGAGQSALINIDLQAEVPKPAITILSVAREAANIRLVWKTPAGKTNVVQTTTGAAGSYSNNFTDLSAPLVVAGSGQVVTNYLHVGGATNNPARYYRIRLVP